MAAQIVCGKPEPMGRADYDAVSDALVGHVLNGAGDGTLDGEGTPLTLAVPAADATGWEWSLVHGIEKGEERSYPFAAELSERLPWLYAVERRK